MNGKSLKRDSAVLSGKRTRKSTANTELRLCAPGRAQTRGAMRRKLPCMWARWPGLKISWEKCRTTVIGSTGIWLTIRCCRVLRKDGEVKGGENGEVDFELGNA